MSPNKKETDMNRQEILSLFMDELASLREEAMSISQQFQIEPVLEAIDFHENELGSITDFRTLFECGGRAVVDVTHEIAVARYGFDSPEADAVFDEEERKLKILRLSLQPQQSARCGT